MKKMVAILAGVMLMMAAGSALADPLNPNLIRPVPIGASWPGENSLQQELDSVFGLGSVNAATDQLDIGMFQIATAGSNLISPQLKFEWTSNASAQTIGIFGWNGSAPAITAQIFAGSQTPGSFATIVWTTSDDGKISSFDKDNNFISQISFSDIDRNFFGFYFQANGSASKYYSVDSLNPNSQARVLGYMPTLSGALFSYEDGTDFDYQDAGFFVESIIPVPEPTTLLLLGFGLFGLAGISRKLKK